MVEVSPKLQVIDGILVRATADVEIVRSALNYNARLDDIFLCSYPKTGTTWMKAILYTLMNDGKSFDNNMAEFSARTPSLENVGERGLNNMHRPYVINTHFPLNRIFHHDKAKYVCVVRNPKDVCVSYYYFLLKMIDGQPDKASFDTFFEAFINGNMQYGDYFEHLHAVWQHKDDANVFLTSYEEMKHDIRAVIRPLAKFLNIELNTDLLERIVTYTSFEYMKERYDKACIAQAQIALANESPTAPWPTSKRLLQMRDKLLIVRKGVVNSWSSIMSEEQAQRLDKIFAEKTADMPGVDKLFLPAQ
jgi:hypothetical protein